MTIITQTAGPAILALVALTQAQIDTAWSLANKAGHAWADAQKHTEIDARHLGDIMDASQAYTTAGHNDGGIQCPSVTPNFGGYGPGAWDITHTTGTRGTTWRVRPDGSAVIEIYVIASPAPLPVTVFDVITDTWVRSNEPATEADAHNVGYVDLAQWQSHADYKALMQGAACRLVGTAVVHPNNSYNIDADADCPAEKLARLHDWALAACGSEAGCTV